MIVVSNTSPLINLAVIGYLDLLHQLYGQVIIPQAVYDEIVILGAGQPGAVEVASSSWIKVVPIQNPAMAISLQAELDQGEAEAVILAFELKAALLLIDERRGRQVATRFGLKITGLLGLLIEAKRQGLIPRLKPLLDDLITQASFWVKAELYQQVLQQVGEI